MGTNMKINIFGISIDALTLDQSVSTLESWLKGSERACRYVVTPNVDHVVMLDSNKDFMAAYRGASLVLTDGRPVAAVARILGSPVPETVPGSDLAPALFERASARWKQDLTVFLLGAGPSVAERAALHIHETWRNVRVVGCYSPPFGFEHSEIECEEIIRRVSESNADLLIIGLGAPKQELWVARYFQRLPVKVALCIGATIDFLAGEKKRAPRWMRYCGVEWLHRMLSEPRRLARRYLKGAIAFPVIVWKEYSLRR